MVTISSTIVFILLFGLAHNNPPHKTAYSKQEAKGYKKNYTTIFSLCSLK